MNILKNENNVTILLEGRLDTITAPELIEAIQDLQFADLTINLEKLEYISSAGLRALLVVKKAADDQGASMTVEKPCTAVLEVMRICGFTKMLHITEGL